MENATLTLVSFHDEIVELVEFNGQPFVAMKRLTANLGLSWPAQNVKLTEKFGSVVAEIATTGADGKVYQMVCLPLRKIFGWLNSIHVNKLAQASREKIRCYQNECDDVLWDYWTQGKAVNPRMTQASLSVYESIALSKERARLLRDVSDCTNSVLASELYKDLQRITSALGDTVAPLAQLAQGLRQRALTLES